MPDDDDPWTLRGHDVARQLGCNESQVYRYAKGGKLPYTLTAGGQRRYRQSDVDAIKAGMQPTLDRPGPTLDQRVTVLEEWRAAHEEGHP